MSNYELGCESEQLSAFSFKLQVASDK